MTLQFDYRASAFDFRARLVYDNAGVGEDTDASVVPSHHENTKFSLSWPKGSSNADADHHLDMPVPPNASKWDDANNLLTVAPGVVVGYQRNTMTNAMLRHHDRSCTETRRAHGRARCRECRSL